MSPENIMQSEWVRHKRIVYDSTYVKSWKQANTETERRTGATWDQGKWEGGVWLNRHRVSVWDGGKTLEIDSSDGYNIANVLNTLYLD